MTDPIVHVHVEPVQFGLGGVKIFMAARTFGSDKIRSALPVQFSEPFDPHAMPLAFPEPVATLQTQMAQALMDQLWSCGIRPTEGTGSAGSLAATERHLKDMQRISFGLLSGASVMFREKP